MKTLSLAAALALCAALGHAGQEAPETVAGQAGTAFSRLNDAPAMIGGFVLELKNSKKPQPQLPQPAPITSPSPLEHYLAGSWVCQDGVKENSGGAVRIGVRRATDKCVNTAADWRAEAEKACAGKCRKVKDPATGKIFVKCGVNDFSVDTPCTADKKTPGRTTP